LKEPPRRSWNGNEQLAGGELAYIQLMRRRQQQQQQWKLLLLLLLKTQRSR